MCTWRPPSVRKGPSLALSEEPAAIQGTYIPVGWRFVNSAQFGRQKGLTHRSVAQQQLLLEHPQTVQSKSLETREFPAPVTPHKRRALVSLSLSSGDLCYVLVRTLVYTMRTSVGLKGANTVMIYSRRASTHPKCA